MSDYPAGTILGAWPVTIGGLELDRVDAFGVEWSLTSVSGWGSAATSGETVDRPGADGAWAPEWTLKPKEYTLSGSVDAETPAARWAAEQRLQQAIGGEDTLMVVHEETERQATVRLNGAVEIVRTSVYTFDFDVAVLALDPRRYSTTLNTRTLSFPSTSGGLVWPATWPATWSAVTVAGDAALLNEGNVTAWPVWRIDGPVTSPVIVNADTGQQSRIDVELGAGQWLVVDPAARHVLADGGPQASRREKFRGDWWGLDPGSTTVRFDGSSAGPGASLTASWRSTWK